MEVMLVTYYKYVKLKDAQKIVLQPTKNCNVLFIQVSIKPHSPEMCGEMFLHKLMPMFVDRRL